MVAALSDPAPIRRACSIVSRSTTTSG